jgi:hypothetical protein
VLPSFWQDTKYSVCAAITAEDLLATECTCKAGCTGEDQHICVHILLVLPQLSILLYDALADHFLVELSSRWNSLNTDFQVQDVPTKIRFVESLKELIETTQALSSEEQSSDKPSNRTHHHSLYNQQ